MPDNTTQMKKKKKLLGITLFAASAILIVLFAAAAVCLGFDYKYKDKIYPRVYIGNFYVGGQTVQDVTTQLVAFKDFIDKEGLVFVAADKQVEISPIISSPTDPDLNYRILNIDVEPTVARAWQIGRSDSWLVNLVKKINVILTGTTITIQYELNEQELLDILQKNFYDVESPAQNASFDFDEQGEIFITNDSSGQAFEYEQAVQQLKQNIANLSNQKINLKLLQDYPAITKAEATKLLPKLKEVLATTTPALVYQKKSWPVSREDLISWLEFDKVDSASVLVFNQAKVEKFLDGVANAVEQEPKDAKFSLVEGKVVEFQVNQDGLEIDKTKAMVNLNSYLFNLANKDIGLPVKTKPARVAIGDVNDLGIKELIGVGTSNYKGSPKNRRLNIAVGAKTLNGILIAPGEEFSLVKALGDIDGEHGYLPELVIKGNATIPEFGGGLCQIGTTSFRVALDAGLPITARKNHSYRVRYYEPAGTDATIYNPSPDFKFINDTGYHILWTTQISGDDITFRFYGTSDGRKVEQTLPRIFNVAAPGPTKLIETMDLPVGQKKCTEHAVYGADTEFERQITFPNGEEKNEVWKSHYVPWTEVCLLGVEQLTTATTTEQVVTE